MRFECREGSRSTIERLVEQFEQTGYMMDSKKGIVGRKKCVRTPENNAHVQEVFTHSPSNSAKWLS
jgi:hypothetical protein